MTKHGHGRTGIKRPSIYGCWINMKQRCFNENHPWFKLWGGRGITVCQRWLKFENFLADMGPKPEGLSIERINNDGNYEPGNCRWSTREDQDKNRRDVRLVTRDGLTLSLYQWSKRIFGNTGTLPQRLRSGWPLEQAMTYPPVSGKRFITQERCRRGHMLDGKRSTSGQRYCKTCARQRRHSGPCSIHPDPQKEKK